MVKETDDKRRLIFDIETSGEDFENLDSLTQDSLTRRARKEAETEELFQKFLENIKESLGLSPLTGQIVSIGLLDVEKNVGAVYFQSPSQEITEFIEGNFKFKSMTEKEMLKSFWQVSKRYNRFISFNGRNFDAPYLIIRSSLNRIRPTKDLLSSRYIRSQKNSAIHIDLLDELTFYGALKKTGGIHLWSRAFGIRSPKASGISGGDIGRLFRSGKYLEIARYNVGDLIATRELYFYWKRYINFSTKV